MSFLNKINFDSSLYNIIKKHYISEKTFSFKNQNKVFFYVENFANKFLVKKAVEKIFDVKVKKISIINTKGKLKVFKGTKGYRQDYKKAIVTLLDGFFINFSKIK